MTRVLKGHAYGVPRIGLNTFGFSRRGDSWSVGSEVPQWLKPLQQIGFTARLKARPFKSRPRRRSARSGHYWSYACLDTNFSSPPFSSPSRLLLAAQQYDTLIRNGRVVDGSGNPWIYADVGIIGDRIAFVGKADASVTAKRTIDATGLIVAPGFIDMLGQSEVNLLIDKQAVSKLTQGITTEITGEGDSIAPTNEKLNQEHADFLQHYHLTADWQSLEEYFERLTGQGSGINLATYVGAAQIRHMVIGTADRAPTPAELKDMEIMVDDAMSDGAMGISSALIYAPGSYATTEELIALAKVAARKGGIYASHIRNEGNAEMDALSEAFRIGREANIPVEIFHLKCAGKQNWGRMPQVIAAIEQARASGVDVTADQYPYTGAATSLGAVIPPKYHAGGPDEFIKRLKDPAVRQQIRNEVEAPSTTFENLVAGCRRSGGRAGHLGAQSGATQV